MEAIEEIILRHSERGMLKLKDYLQADYCRCAAEEIMSWKRGVVFMTTGFYVAGFPETDGPAGTAVLAGALKGLASSRSSLPMRPMRSCSRSGT